MMSSESWPAKLAKVAMWLVLPLLTACGGSGGGTPPVVQPPQPVVEMGVFIDSPVQGLGFSSGAVSGTTDENGMFDYTVGETLTFSVGGIELGTLAAGKALVTPDDFGAASENIARFLQTLDADGEHINGIDLSVAATALANSTMDASAFTSDATTFEITIQPILDLAIGAGALLIDADVALANLAAALDSTFEVAELAGAVLIVDLPLEDETGIAVFDPLADPSDSGSSVTMFMKSDTIAAGGDGTTTVLDWSVDGAGILSITDPFDMTVISIEKVGGSLGIISIKLTQGAEELVGSFLVPANGVALDLTGDDGRSYEVDNDAGTSLVSFFPDGRLTRIANDLVFVDTWTLDDSGSLLTVANTDGLGTVGVLSNGSLAVGGETMTFYVLDFGVPGSPIYELQDMVIGSISPISFPDPSTAVAYDFTSSATAFSLSDPNLTAAFAGATVTGSFSYANWVPPINVLTGPTQPGSALYAGSLLDMAGSVAGLNFADAFGFSVVGNDRFGVDLVDFLSISAFGLDSGFEIAGYTLTAVRPFWIEGDTTPGDFLQSDLLPAALPIGLVGRIALDFELTADPNIRASVFFSDFSVTLSP
jgi:hypothetical protein